MRAVTVGFAFVLLAFATLAQAKLRPVVLLHGLMATKEAMSGIESWLRADFPGIYVYNADIPTVNSTDSKLLSLLIDMNQQVADFASQIQADPNLADGFDLVCHSQGGLNCRAYLERFNKPTVHNFVSLAGPQAGVFGVPDFNDWCPDSSCPWLVDWFNGLSESGWTGPFLQSHISFAQYWKNPLNWTEYLATSGFIADINNERAVKNSTYKANLVSTTGTVALVMANDDHIVVPKESAWFGFFKTGQDSVLVNVTETEQYQQDWIGLRTLNEAGRLAFHAVDCTHQNLPRDKCKPQVYDAIIKPLVGGQI